MMTDADMDFDLLVQQVRRVFFPRWDAQRWWLIVEADEDDPELYGGCHGRCNGEKKTITISRPRFATQTVDERWHLLIHEIAHTQGSTVSWWTVFKRLLG